MVIGFDASRAQLGERAGPENYTYNILKYLLRIDRQNFYRLYLRRDDPEFLKTLTVAARNFETRLIPWPRLWTQGGLALECLRRPPDVLFITAHTIPIFRRPSLKTVVTIHDVGLQRYLEAYQRRTWRLYGGRISSYAARAATRVIAVSQSTKRDLVEQLGVDPARITVVYEGVDHQQFKVQSAKRKAEGKRRLRRKYGLDGDYFLFVGTIQPRKNLVRLIEAFARGAPSHFKLILVGKRGWLFDDIYAAPHRFGVTERVRFLGYVPPDDLVSLFNNACAFLFPSLYEGFGLVVLEALSCGCPVLTSDVSSLPEVVGKAGILVNPYRVDEIAAGIRKLAEMGEEERQRLVELGLSQARRFSWEKAARETLAVLKKAAG